MINQAQTRSGGRGGWIAGMAILGLGMPIIAFWLSRGMADYRATVAALVIGIFGGIVALLGNRALRPTWQRGLVIGMASLGILIGAYLLWTLVGLCGLSVLWGMCRP